MKTNSSLKDQTEKLKKRLDGQLKNAEELIKTTGMPGSVPNPPETVLDRLIEECRDHIFWTNFKNSAPYLFCSAVDSNPDIKQVKDLTNMDELCKTMGTMQLMIKKLETDQSNVDLIEYSMALQLLENKLSVLKTLYDQKKTTEDGKITLSVNGSSRKMIIDVEKLKEAITVLDGPVQERQASAEDHMTKITEIDISGDITEEEYLNKAVELIGDLKKNANKTLQKDSFIKIFKYAGDFAKLKNKNTKGKLQEERCQYFQQDNKQYYDALKKCVQEEEKSYEQCSIQLFDRLNLSSENFERSQEALMQDPSVQMELFNLGINMEKPTIKAPEELTEAKVIELTTESNNFAFDLFKKEYLSSMANDPMIMPVLFSAIAHDYVYKNHGWSEEQFKAALFHFKIYENPQVVQQMQTKHIELMMLAQSQNPMNPMGMGGGMPPGMGMGGGFPQGGPGGLY